jgi:hypothetical protein
MEEDDTGFAEESVATAEEVANSEKGEVQPRKKRKTRRRRDRAEQVIRTTSFFRKLTCLL